MSVDLSKELRLAVARAGGQKAVVLEMKISEPDLSRKINGERDLKIHELQRFFEIAELYVSNGSKDASDFQLIKEQSRKLYEVMQSIDGLDGGKAKGGVKDG